MSSIVDVPVTPKKKKKKKVLEEVSIDNFNIAFLEIFSGLLAKQITPNDCEVLCCA